MSGFNPVIHPMTVIQGTVASVGDVLGTGCGPEIIQKMNSQQGSTYIGSQGRFARQEQLFFNQIVQPIFVAQQQLTTVAQITQNPDAIRPLVTLEDFKYIPPSMQMPILLMPEVMDLHARGRVWGFGIDPEDLKDAFDGNPWERVAYNGVVNDVFDKMDDQGRYTSRYVWCTDDPVIDYDDRLALRETFEFLREQVLPMTDIDPTDGNAVRG